MGGIGNGSLCCVKIKVFFKWGLKLGIVYVGRFMAGYRLVIGERRGVCISPVVMCKT